MDNSLLQPTTEARDPDDLVKEASERESQAADAVPKATLDKSPDDAESDVLADGQDPDGWPDVDLGLLEPTDAPAPIFPIETLPLQLRGLVMGFAGQRRLPLDYVAGSVIGACAIAIGNRARLVGFDGRREPLPVFIALIGAPASGKSQALDIASEPLNRIEEALIAADEAARSPDRKGHSLSSLASVLRDGVARRLRLEGRSGSSEVQGDDGVAPPGLLLTETTVAGLLDELAGGIEGRGILNHELTSLLSSGNGQAALKTRGILLQGFDGGVYRKRTATSGLVTIPALHLSIVGATQPDRVKTLIGNARDGLVPRFLWIAPDANPTAEMAVGSGQTMLFEQLLTRLIQIEPARDEGGYSQRIVLLEDTRQILEAASRRWIDAQIKADGLMKDVYARGRQQALRLATVLAQAEHTLAGAEGVIPSLGQAAVERGILLVDQYFIGMAERVIGMVGAPAASDAARLALFLRRIGKTVVSVRDDIYRGAGSPVRRTAAVAVALEELRQRGFIRDVERGGSVGRPALMIEVHPNLIDG